ncbi:hypothetical protein D3C71_1993050 [compost metagenome]
MLKGWTGYFYDVFDSRFGGNLNDRGFQFDLSWTVGHGKEELASICKRAAHRCGVRSIDKSDLDN